MNKGETFLDFPNGKLVQEILLGPLSVMRPPKLSRRCSVLKSMREFVNYTLRLDHCHTEL